jgi:hypothetical protein
MAIISRGQFASIAQSKAGLRGLRGVVNESRMFTKATASTSIFLSHSHHDKDIVEQAKIFFENLGISIYVDWADETLPEKPDSATAIKIKHQIISVNDKFVLLATNNAVASKWCNWELGVADPFKLPTKQIIIFPLADNSGNWTGNEYLKIYPRLERGSLNANEYYVWYPDDTLEPLSEWLKRNKDGK